MIVFLNHFLVFWHCWMFWAHLICFLSSPRISYSSKELISFHWRNQDWVLGVLVATGVSVSVSADRNVYVLTPVSIYCKLSTYKHWYLYWTIYHYEFILMSSTLIHFFMHHLSFQPLLFCNLLLQQCEIWFSLYTINLLMSLCMSKWRYVQIYICSSFRIFNSYPHGSNFFESTILMYIKFCFYLT